jgi:hypothetical protein
MLRNTYNSHLAQTASIYTRVTSGTPIYVRLDNTPSNCVGEVAACNGE